jgi:hypothetical protein
LLRIRERMYPRAAELCSYDVHLEIRCWWDAPFGKVLQHFIPSRQFSGALDPMHESRPAKCQHVCN